MNLFKKSLLATSIVAVAGFAAAQSQINNGGANPPTLALEGTVAAGTINIGPNQAWVGVFFETEATYIENDVLEVYISGAPIDLKKSAPQLNLYNVAGSVNFLDADAEKGLLRFRVQDEVNPTGTGEAFFDLTGVVLDASALQVNDSITVSTKAISLNPAIGDYDEIAATTVARIDSQFELDTSYLSGFDGVIDVESGKEVFINSNGNPTQFDYASTGFSNNSGYLNAISFNRYVYQIKGEDLSHAMAFDSNEDGELSDSEASFLAGAYSAYTNSDDVFSTSVNEDLTTVTTVQTSPGSLDGYVQHYLQSSGDGSGIPTMEQEFTASIFAQNTAAEYTLPVVQNADFGEWTLNGASVFVPYMPYSNTSELSQIIYVSNKGSQAGMISVTAFDDDGNSYGPYDMGNLAGNEVRKLTTDLNARLYADGFSSGKVGFVVTVTAPSKHVEVYSAYKAGNDRGTVINSKSQ